MKVRKKIKKFKINQIMITLKISQFKKIVREYKVKTITIRI